MMTSFVFVILIFLNFVVFPCEGKIKQPPSGNSFIVVSGSDVTIEWSFDEDTSEVDSRSWSFINSDGKLLGQLARIVDDRDPEIRSSSLPGVVIKKPATLVLKKVDLSYNGTYEFFLSLVSGGRDTSYVTVFVAVKPVATVCSSSTTVDEGGDVRCECKGEGGNPPANVTWYKDGVQIGETADEKNILTLINVNKTDSGTYICVAQSYVLKDEGSLKVTVRPSVAPTVTSFTSVKAVLGRSVTLKCDAEGRPSPTYTIIYNETRTVSTEKTYTIEEVKYSHAGWYKCIAKNKLGNDSMALNLTVSAEDPESKTDESSGGLGGGAIAGIVIGVLLLLVIVIVVVWWCKFRGNKNGDRRTAASRSGERSAPVYADVRKDPKSNEPTYAVLDKNALNTGGDTTAKRDSGEPTQYADIEFGVRGDLV